jgi:glucokinase
MMTVEKMAYKIHSQQRMANRAKRGHTASRRHIPKVHAPGLKDFCGGVDIGGTKIASALFSAAGDMTAKVKVPIEKSGGDRAAAQVATTVRDLVAAAAEAGGRLRAVGICVPGIVYSASGRVWAPNIPGWDRYPLGQWLGGADRNGGRDRQGPDSERRPSRVRRGDSVRHFQGTSEPGLESLPIVLESDRSACVLGETWRGAAAGASDVVFLAVGTGIGAGILSSGRLIHGHEDIAGAVGWFGLNPDFKPAYAGIGCFEAEASGNSVGRKARELLAQGRMSLMKDLAGGRIEGVTSETVAAAARLKDALALEVVADAARYLGMGIANIVSLLNPEVVVLGGGLFQAADVFLEPARREFRKWAQPMAAEKVRVVASALGEDAGLYGCGKLAWDQEGADSE